MRLCVSPTGLYTYPDVMAVCGEPQFQDDEVDTLLNPTMIVEVLSPIDRILRPRQEVRALSPAASLTGVRARRPGRGPRRAFYAAGETGFLTELSRIDDTLRLASIDCEVPLREIYAKVEFSPEAATEA